MEPCSWSSNREFVVHTWKRKKGPDILRLSDMYEGIGSAEVEVNAATKIPKSKALVYENGAVPIAVLIITGISTRHKTS